MSVTYNESKAKVIKDGLKTHLLMKFVMIVTLQCPLNISNAQIPFGFMKVMVGFRYDFGSRSS
jgi:hypothetical protein